MLGLFFMSVLFNSINAKSSATKMETLFTPDYDKRTAPPSVEEGKPNDIRVALDIATIPHLDEKMEQIVLEVRIAHHWIDLRLDTSMLDGKPLELEPDAIAYFWVPDSFFQHAKDAKTVKIITPAASLQVTPEKMVKYTELVMLTLGCPMTFYDYPMDIQECYIRMQSFGYDSSYYNYSWIRDPHLETNIHLDNHDVKIIPFTYADENDNATYPGLGVKIDLKRHLGYHLTQTYIPSIIFVIVAWLSFIVPSDIVPGRMVLCVTTLLTLTSMFNSVRNLTPNVSYMKAIDLWVFVCILFVFSSLAEYGWILHLTSRSVWQRKIDKTRKDESKINPVQLVSLRIINLSEDLGVFYPNTAQKLSKAQDQLHDHASEKEKCAYKVEYLARFLYPLAFFGFNIVYWSFYLAKYFRFRK